VAAFTVVGKAKLAGADVVRSARPASMVWPGQIGQFSARARLCQNLVMGVSDESAPLLLDINVNGRTIKAVASPNPGAD